MDQSPRLSLSYLMPAQAQKHVTVNETFRRLDQLVQQTVLSRTVTAEPGAPNDGDAYILPASPTGTAWATYAQNNIAAYQDGAWTQISAAEGFSAWVADTDEFIIYDGAAWSQVSGGSESAAKFGVNTTADATNKFVVKSNAVLFDALDAGEGGTGDSQVKVNKEAVGDTASHLFQTAFSGRAEFGLTGDDDFHIKVSANGSAWTEAVFIDKDNGNVGFGTTAPAYATDIIGDIRVASNETDATLKTGRLFTRHYTNSEEDVLLFSSVIGNGFSSMQYGGGSGLHNAVTAIQFFTASSTTTLSGAEAMRITGAGNVGIGETSPGSKLHVDGGGIQCGNPTGGDKGTGAINAEFVYDDNTLLTCYVFDQVLDGAIDDAKWDGKTPDRIIPAKRELDENTGEDRVLSPEQRITRIHAPMRKFRARIGTLEDPLTLDGYSKHWREKRHLTSMPNEATFDPASGLSSGEWVQRLVETVEIQAVLIEQLNQRLKALEISKLAR